MNKIIEIKNLYKSFDNTEVLNNINVSFNKGTVSTIIGPSGSGKSTLLRCINQLETATSGSIFFQDQDITNVNTKLNEVRTKIGMVFQSFNLFDNLTVLENCIIGPVRVLKENKDQVVDRALKYLERVGMLDFKDRSVTTLSGGQKQRVAIARTLCMNPEVILFDEPTSSLDPEMVHEVLEVIQSVINDEMCFIIVTHEMEFARKVSDTIIFMDNGTIIESGSPTEIFEESNNERLNKFIKK